MRASGARHRLNKRHTLPPPIFWSSVIVRSMTQVVCRANDRHMSQVIWQYFNRPRIQGAILQGFMSQKGLSVRRGPNACAVQAHLVKHYRAEPRSS